MFLFKVPIWLDWHVTISYALKQLCQNNRISSKDNWQTTQDVWEIYDLELSPLEYLMMEFLCIGLK